MAVVIDGNSGVTTPTSVFTNSSGNVGVGTTSPQKKFVVSDAGATGMEWSPTDYTGNMRQLAYNRSTSAYVALRTEASQHEWYIGGTERARIDASGNVLVTGGGGLGYGTGSGGTVTQTTNKSTAVTLNKITGQITMNNAALGAGASVSFIVNNSLLTTSDTVVVTPSNNANYSSVCIAAVAGAFYVRVTNLTAGSLNDALALNFAVIKGATS